MNTLKRLWTVLRERQHRLWVSAALSSLVAVLFALGAAGISRYLPDHWVPDIPRETLDTMLGVVASSMLAVTTFSLSIMVSAFAAAANGATPRATELVMGDEGTRSAIAMFLAAFIYAVVAQTALGIGYYGSAGRFVLFVGTVLMLAALLISLIRWVKTLSSLGRLTNTLAKLETAATTALTRHWRAPWLGAAPAPATLPAGDSVHAARIAYVRSVDMAALQALADTHDCQLHVRVCAGTLVTPDTELVRIEATPADAATPEEDAEARAARHDQLCTAIRGAFYFGTERNFDQDPRFGLLALSETAQRALSPAVNDPGTAIDVMNRLTRTLLNSAHAARNDEAPALDYPRLTMVAIDEAEFIFDSFDPIARDGAGLLEICLRMQRLLAGIAASPAQPVLARAARDMARRAHQRASQRLDHDFEREAVDACHAEVCGG